MYVRGKRQVTESDNACRTVTVTETARMLGIGRGLAYKLAKAGRLPGVIRIGERRLVISKLALEGMLAEAGRGPAQ